MNSEYSQQITCTTMTSKYTHVLFIHAHRTCTRQELGENTNFAGIFILPMVTVILTIKLTCCLRSLGSELYKQYYVTKHP